MTRVTLRYQIEFLDEPVAHVGSIAGLDDALLDAKATTVSLAYPREASWLVEWAEHPSRRGIVVRDRLRGRAIDIDALGITDVSGSGLIFELAIAAASLTRRRTAARSPAPDQARRSTSLQIPALTKLDEPG